MTCTTTNIITNTIELTNTIEITNTVINVLDKIDIVSVDKNWWDWFFQIIQTVGTIAIPIIISIFGYIYQRESRDKELIKDLLKNVRKYHSENNLTRLELMKNEESDVTDFLNQSIKKISYILNNDLILFQFQNKSRIKLIKELCELLNKTKIHKANAYMNEEECIDLLNTTMFLDKIEDIIIWNDKKLLKRYGKFINTLENKTKENNNK